MVCEGINGKFKEQGLFMKLVLPQGTKKKNSVAENKSVFMCLIH